MKGLFSILIKRLITSETEEDDRFSQQKAPVFDLKGFGSSSSSFFSFLLNLEEKLLHCLSERVKRECLDQVLPHSFPPCHQYGYRIESSSVVVASSSSPSSPSSKFVSVSQNHLLILSSSSSFSSHVVQINSNSNRTPRDFPPFLLMHRIDKIRRPQTCVFSSSLTSFHLTPIFSPVRKGKINRKTNGKDIVSHNKTWLVCRGHSLISLHSGIFNFSYRPHPQVSTTRTFTT